MPPVIETMESQCGCDLKFESHFRIHCNLPAQTFFRLVLMRLIENPNTLCTVRVLAIA